MPTYQQLQSMTMPELRELAGSAGLTSTAKLRKPELIEAVAAALGLRAPAAESQASEVVEHVLAGLPSSPTAGLAAPERTPSPVEAGYEFPFSYNQDQAVLLVRDPHWLFCLWDISGPTWAELERRGIVGGETAWQPVLRFHDVSDSAEPTLATLVRELTVFGDSRDWYLDVPKPGREYQVEFGYRSRTGEFFRVAVSNRATAPRATPSERYDVTFASLYDEAFRLSIAGGDPTEAADSASVRRRLELQLQEVFSSGRFSPAAHPATPSGD